MIWKIGDWEVNPDACRICRGAEERRVTPRAMDVLGYLAERPGEIVTPETLVDRFWPNPFVGENAVHKIVSELRHALDDDSRQPRYLRTIPKRGYQLVASVMTDVGGVAATAAAGDGFGAPISIAGAENSPLGAATDTTQTANGSEASKRPRRSSRLRVGASALVGFLMAAAATAAIWLADPTPSAKISARSPETIAVLRFRNVDDNPEHAHIAEGIAFALLKNLSWAPGLRVVEPERSFQYSVAEAPWQSIAATLDSRYVLDGSVQGLGDRIRISLSLYDALRDEKIYEYSKDEPIERILEIQDQTLTRVLTELSVHLDDEDYAQMLDWGTRNARAYLAAVEGQYFIRRSELRSIPLAAERLRQAVALDPSFLRAYVSLSDALGHLGTQMGMSEEERAELRGEISAIRERVSQIDPTYADLAHIRWNEIRVGSGRFWAQLEAQARTEIQAAGPPREANYNYVLYADYLMTAHLFEEAIQFLDVYAKFDPESPWPDVRRCGIVAITQGPHLGIPACEKSLRSFPDSPFQLVGLASQYLLAGDYESAERVHERILAVDPSPNAAYAYSVWLYLSAARGDFSAGSAELLQATTAPGVDEFSAGLTHLMLGDLESGLALWGRIPEERREIAYRVTVHAEEYMPAAVVQDPRYRTYLDEMGLGIQWTEFMRGKVAELSPITGVLPAGPAPQAVWHAH